MKNHRSRGIVLLLVSASFLLGFRLVKSHMASLLQGQQLPVSTLFAKASRTRVNCSRTPYFWTSDGSIACLEQNRINQYQLVRIDAATGERAVPTLIPQQWTEVVVDDSWHLSPDGEKLLWGSGFVTNPKWVVMDLRSNQCVVWPRRGDYSDYFPHISQAVWLHDSEHWAEVSDKASELHILVHNLKRPQAARLIRITGIGEGPVLGISQCDHLFYLPLRPIPPMREWRGDMVDINIQSLHPSVRQFNLHSVHSYDSLRGFLLSPDGTQLAWLLEVGAHSIGERTFVRQRLLVGPAGEGPDREVGSVIAETTDPNQYIASICWTADSKQLSFWSGEAIWLVKAPPNPRSTQS